MSRIALVLAVAMACNSDDVSVETDISDTDTVIVTAAACTDVYGDNSIGIQRCLPGVAEGYTLFSPNRFSTTYLIDYHGDLVHQWDTGYNPGHSAYLLETGNLLRTAQDNPGTRFMAGGSGGRVQEIDWDGNVLWDFAYNTDAHFLHHDIEPLPSGNILMIAWQYYDQAAAIEAGRLSSNVDGQGVWVDSIIEVDPATDDIVWDWFVFDHLVQDVDGSKENFGVIADNPNRIDFNRVPLFGGPMGGMNPDWNHLNGIDYNAELDQILVSAKHQDELWVIDKASGDIVYRWGNPTNYGAPGAKVLSGQHDPEWIDPGLPGEGNILVFNNGVEFGYSTIVEFEPAVEPDGTYPLTPGDAWGPEQPSWTFADPDTFFSSYISGVNRLANGNTLICEGASGRFFEVTEAGDVVWEYINPVNSQGPMAQGDNPSGAGVADNGVFRADKYPPDYPGFAGKDLTPQGSIER